MKVVNDVGYQKKNEILKPIDIEIEEKLLTRGAPLAGVNVIIKGTTKGATNGKYTIEAPAGSTSLNIGYGKKFVGNKTEINTSPLKKLLN